MEGNALAVCPKIYVQKMESNMDKTIWGEALRANTYLINSTETSVSPKGTNTTSGGVVWLQARFRKN